MLLRVVDPGFKTETPEDYGLAYVFISFFEITIIYIVPSLVANGISLAPALVLLGGFIACMSLSKMFMVSIYISQKHNCVAVRQKLPNCWISY